MFRIDKQLTTAIAMRGSATISAFIAGQGVADAHAEAIAAGIIAAILAAADGIASWKRARKRKAD